MYQSCHVCVIFKTAFFKFARSKDQLSVELEGLIELVLRLFLNHFLIFIQVKFDLIVVIQSFDIIGNSLNSDRRISCPDEMVSSKFDAVGVILY